MRSNKLYWYNMSCPPVTCWWSFRRLLFDKCACVCAVSTCLHHTCGNHIISCWNTWSCLNVTDALYLCLFTFCLSLHTLFCRSCYTSYSHANVLLFLFFCLSCFFSTETIITLSIPFAPSCTYTLTDILAFSHERTCARAHLSRHLRFLPFSIFECSGIIIILVSVWVREREAGIWAASLL